ncbi:MAG: cyclophilin-like fold protein [Coriobacteriales bacterium]
MAAVVIVFAFLLLAMPLMGCTSQSAQEQASGNSSTTEATSTESEEATAQTDQSTTEGNDMNKFQIEVGGKTFLGTFGDTEAAAELEHRLPLVLDMSELSGNEKYYKTGQDFPGTEETPSELHSGEIWIYSGDYIVLFYEDHSNPGYSYQFAGSLDDPEGLADAVGSGNVQVTITKQQ